MSNFVKLELPNNQFKFKRVYKLSYMQENYQHDFARVFFRDWAISPTQLRSGSPMVIELHGKKFYGYVHDVRSHQDNNSNFTEVGFIGASWVMRQASQQVYSNVTADQIIVQIAKKYNFGYKVTPHPRVFPHISQAGMTDWEFMVKLAKQSGYFLRAENTVLYFQPLLEDFEGLIHEANNFIKADAGIKSGPPLYYFKPIIGETLSHHGADKSATSIAGINPETGKLFKYTKQNRSLPTRTLSNPEMFDKHATHVVANTYEAAISESNAADNKSVFPYVAETQVIGTAELRPGMPVHLDNVGKDYTGYWTVLRVEHEVLEENLNVQVYSTTLSVGTDSLGEVAKPQYPRRPASKPFRHIVPNVRNTRLKPETKLKSNGIHVQQTKQTGLVNRINRADLNSKSLIKAAWSSVQGNLNTKQPSPTSPVQRFKVSANAARG
ncbi:Phage late control gene D protein (GPD) [uncultured Caudovirales phage]|uniref:Phage late control gene D protein (GPD) n=1 Tax=uncultured Caudovirales phage TaxID=2100421 RepID=A0A6J5L4A7_9CAUD|nr:Phage late control gene D protein (GPD) [uncultured Caudovirales phage]CAB5218948.1 Phage late control gene D protein (GPD) [uncultured Caudovirales phage]